MSAAIPAFPARSYAFTPYVAAQNWIGGTWVDAISGATLPVENPRHAKVMSHVAMSGAADVDAAVKAAAAAFKTWKLVPIKERARLEPLAERFKREAGIS